MFWDALLTHLHRGKLTGAGDTFEFEGTFHMGEIDGKGTCTYKGHALAVLPEFAVDEEGSATGSRKTSASEAGDEEENTAMRDAVSGMPIFS